MITQTGYLIGAYRDNEVDEKHPLTATIKSIKQLSVAVQTIALKPLRQQAVGDNLLPT